MGTTTVYIDDIRLWTYRTIDGTASISQTFQKPWATDGTPGSAVFRFDYRNVEYANLTGLNMTVRVNDTARSWTWWHNFTGPEPWTIVAAAIGNVMAPAGTYDINISVRVTAFTPHAYRFDVQIDNVDLRAPNYRSGWYLSIPLDAGRVSNWGNVSWTETLAPLTDVWIEARSGATVNTADGSWSDWSSYTSPVGGPIASPPNRFLQYRVNLITLNASVTPVLNDITIEFGSYRPAGTITTMPFDPGVELIRWTRFNASTATPPDTSVAFEISFDGGSAWNPVSPGDLLSGNGTPIALRATLATGNTSRTPALSNMTVDYEFRDVLASISISPSSWSGTTDQSIRLVAEGFDAWGHPVAIAPTWSTTDPKGVVDTDGTYHPGQPGIWFVTAANATGGISRSATVLVSPGAVARLTISPQTVVLRAAALQPFTLEAWDADDNILDLAGKGTRWTTDVGTFPERTDANATLRAQGVPGAGVVRAAVGSQFAEARVTVTSVGIPIINGVVPDQWSPPNGGAWTLDLGGYAVNQPDPGDTPSNLKWTLEGRDADLVSTSGENILGNHRITFVPRENVNGDDEVILWLEDATGARSNQTLTIHIRPAVNPLVSQLPWYALVVAAVAGGIFVAYDRLYRRFAVEDVFLIGREGRLIHHNTRRLRPDRDPDILAAMMTAIMDFVHDSFREDDAQLRKFELQDRVVAVERGSSFIAAAIYSGREPPWVAEDLRRFVAVVEEVCGDKLARWSGDVEDVREVRDIAERFVRSRHYSSRWAGAGRFLSRRKSQT